MSKENVGEVKWLDDGWNAWINGQHFRSFGIGEICGLVAAQIPGDVEWEVRGKKLVAQPSTKVTKLSKKDQA